MSRGVNPRHFADYQFRRAVGGGLGRVVDPHPPNSPTVFVSDGVGRFVRWFRRAFFASTISKQPLGNVTNDSPGLKRGIATLLLSEQGEHGAKGLTRPRIDHRFCVAP